MDFGKIDNVWISDQVQDHILWEDEGRGRTFPHTEEMLLGLEPSSSYPNYIVNLFLCTCVPLFVSDTNNKEVIRVGLVACQAYFFGL